MQSKVNITERTTEFLSVIGDVFGDFFNSIDVIIEKHKNNSNENKLTKYILLSLVDLLKAFLENENKLVDIKNDELISKINSIISQLNERVNKTFLAKLDSKTDSLNMSLVLYTSSGYREMYKQYLMLLRIISVYSNSSSKKSASHRNGEKELEKVEWDNKNVLVGDLKNSNQLDVCLEKNFYHIPAKRIANANSKIQYVAIYQSKRIFGADAGIKYYGEVASCKTVKRCDIKEIPSNRTDDYYCFEIKEWKKLPTPIKTKECTVLFTNLYLLEHSKEVPELLIGSENEYNLYYELSRAVKRANNKLAKHKFNYNEVVIAVKNQNILVSKNDKVVDKISISMFSKYPSYVLEYIASKY